MQLYFCYTLPALLNVLMRLCPYDMLYYLRIFITHCTYIGYFAIIMQNKLVYNAHTLFQANVYVSASTETSHTHEHVHAHLHARTNFKEYLTFKNDYLIVAMLIKSKQFYFVIIATVGLESFMLVHIYAHESLLVQLLLTIAFVRRVCTYLFVCIWECMCVFASA